MITCKKFNLTTAGNSDIIDITPQVVKEIGGVAVSNGTVTVFVTGSTAAVTTIEFEQGLLSDFKSVWERLVPRNIPFQHDSAWDESNGFSHVRASLLGPSLVVPLVDGVLTLGAWQQIVLVDFDHRARSREIVVQVMGE